jgi:hypothetical protein
MTFMRLLCKSKDKTKICLCRVQGRVDVRRLSKCKSLTRIINTNAHTVTHPRICTFFSFSTALSLPFSALVHAANCRNSMSVSHAHIPTFPHLFIHTIIHYYALVCVASRRNSLSVSHTHICSYIHYSHYSATIFCTSVCGQSA